MNPLVSVIIPTYSRPENLIRAIESVLCQTYKSIEIIVVDDNGINSSFQKDTENLLNKYIKLNKINYIIHDVNKNGSAARNTGFKNSAGYYINFLDDDDVMSPEKIEKQVKFLNNNSQYGACFCDAEIITGRKHNITHNPSQANWVESILLGEAFFNTSAVLFRRDVINELNGFDESFLRHQDYELYMRFLRKYNFGNSNCIALKKYSTPNIISKSPIKSIEFMEKFLYSFQEDILCQKRGNKIFKYQYEKLTELLLASMHYTKAGYCFIQSLKYGLPSIKGIGRYIYFIIRPIFYGKFN